MLNFTFMGLPMSANDGATPPGETSRKLLIANECVHLSAIGKMNFDTEDLL